MSSERLSVGHRILLIGAAIAAVVGCGMAWWQNQKFRQANAMTPYALGQMRDAKYVFTVSAYGYTYKGETGNVIDEEVLVFGVFEKERLYFLRDYLSNLANKDAVVLDIGANTGNHSLFLSRHAAKVHAFEPFPPVIRRFRENLELSPGVKNIELHEVGLGDKDAELPFFAPPSENPGIGTFRTDAAKLDGRQTFESKLRIVRGDDWLKDRLKGPVALVKVDVEGFEESVLKGMQQTLKAHRPLMMIEVTPPPTGTIRTMDELKQLLPEDYEFQVLDGRRSAVATMRGQYHLRPLLPKTFETKGALEIVAYPAEKRDLVPTGK